ncbi:hypothetical protein SS50377_25974 [Spironucleus salmonicida]|uniref:Myb-like DNA-binding domain-containing protein n=1 Tax=Spironucleus salmonicida TaxID=348837 RepID=V6LR47_9EUKA|nr:hypothetical protein SS50377_25974 [Spironucleus salmonicida]|eukprot:EST43239.1 Hypothetical protein SS50377_17104 [Spironucleus salmonicida]
MNKYHQWSNIEVKEMMYEVKRATCSNGRISWKQVAQRVKYGNERQLKRQYNNIKSKLNKIGQNKPYWKNNDDTIIDQIIRVISMI